ncbi:hypothetical protein H0H81_000216 [Sphagnurus paluster]|uniref:Uncharacterized protein n=1 Tax=Sphagnurus paluster TaxID=117069 RepID=A0A9P7FPK1_9AGAR|nr:hypothetical protein H0H81_000216 [Sphagnurus paluster]
MTKARPAIVWYEMLKEDIDSPSPDTESLPEQKPQGRSKVLLLAIAAAVAIILVVVAIVVPVVLTRKHHSDAGAPSGGSQPSTTPNPHQPSSNTATSGKSGSRITLEDGTTFTYTNNFDGEWAFDPKQPFGPGGQAQSWSKRVGAGEDWVWGVDIVRGVNLG